MVLNFLSPAKYNYACCNYWVICKNCFSFLVTCLCAPRTSCQLCLSRIWGNWTATWTWVLASCLPPRATWASQPVQLLCKTSRPGLCSVAQLLNLQASSTAGGLGSWASLWPSLPAYGAVGVWGPGCRYGQGFGRYMGHPEQEGECAMPEWLPGFLPGEGEKPGGW